MEIHFRWIFRKKPNLTALLVGGGFVFHTESEYTCEEVRSKQAFHYDEAVVVMHEANTVNLYGKTGFQSVHYIIL